MASRLAIEAPDVAARSGGLLSVANVVQTGDPHVAMGVSYPDSGLCAPVQIAPDTCWTTYGVALGVDGKVFDGFGEIDGPTFAVYKGIECWLGTDDYTSDATAALELGESTGVERAFQTTVLDDSPTTVIADVGPVTALAALEAWAGSQFGTRATLHVGLFGATWLAQRGVLVRNLDGTLETHLGTLVAVGAGYGWDDVVDPDYSSFDMWITPQVNLFPGPVTVSVGQDRTLNTQRALAERVWSATLACPVVGKATVPTLTENLPEVP